MKARKRLRKSPPLPRRSVIDVDPEELAVPDDNESPGESEPEAHDLANPAERTADDVAAATHKDVGDLYGVHVTPASDRELADATDVSSYQDATLGETFTEELLAKSTEGGTLPEHEVVVLDDSDDQHPTHHPTESGDRPVADNGSGGPGGL